MCCRLFAKKESGKFVVVRAEGINVPVAEAYTIGFSGVKLSNKDGMFGKSDPFLVVERVLLRPMGERVKKEHVFVAMTEQIQNNLSPIWRPLLIPTIACGGMDEQLRLSVFDYDNDGTHVCCTALLTLVHLALTAMRRCT
jgi:hypothetical protein